MYKSVFIVITALLICSVASGQAEASEVQFQPHFNASGSHQIIGFYPSVQLVLPNLNATPIKWNLYFGGQLKWMFSSGNDLSLELLSGVKGSDGSTSGLLSLRSDGTWHNFPLIGGCVTTSVDFEYYYRDRGFYAFFKVEKLLLQQGQPGQGIYGGIECEWYTDKYGTPDHLDYACRLNIPIGKVNLRPVYYFEREMVRIYFALNFSI